MEGRWEKKLENGDDEGYDFGLYERVVGSSFSMIVGTAGGTDKVGQEQNVELPKYLGIL